jgi:hypothetical protein
MAKWLVAGAIVIAALAVLLWMQIREPSAAPSPSGEAAKPSTATGTVAAPSAAATKPEAVALAEPDQPKKLDPQSDAFFYRFDETVPANLTRAAADCYTGGLNRVHRNQKLKLGFKTRIVKGEVTVTELKVLESTLNNPALEACFVQKVTAAHWHDDELPDWTQDDQLVIRPERGMKKFTKENMDYEGDGPIGPAVMKPGQAPPKSDTATREGAEL